MNLDDLQKKYFIINTDGIASVRVCYKSVFLQIAF